MNINGALFIFLTNMTFQNVFAVINVKFTYLFITYQLDVCAISVRMKKERLGTLRRIVIFYCRLQVFCTELPIFLREHRNGMYRTDVYFLCKTLAEAPIFIAVPLLFTVVAYPMIGLYPGIDHFFITAGIVALVANVSTSFGTFCFSRYAPRML